MSGIYAGNGISYLIVNLIAEFGWRKAYLFTGITGIVIGIATLILVKDPIRGRFDPKLKKKNKKSIAS